MSFYLHSLGHFHPENEITNQFLTDLDIGTNEAWIDERVGISSRRTVMPLDYIRETHNKDLAAAIEAAEYSHADTGAIAAKMALERAGLAADDIGMVIAGSSCPDHMSPADACMIAQRLGIEAPAFDVNSACTSFHVAMFMLSNMRPETVPEHVLLVTPESLTTTVDYSDRSAAVLWGDGTTAAVVSTKVPSRCEIVGNLLESSPAGADKVTVPHFGHFGQEGRTVQMFAIKKTIRVLKKLRKLHGSDDRPFHFVGHQANLRMLETVCRQCDIDDAHHHSNVIDYGNTGAAGAPGVVSMRWDDWKAGDDVAIVGVGSGLTWSGYVMRFGEAA
jgi:3-oxoacyl-[acyl-carrier-protein] synthase-3